MEGAAGGESEVTEAFFFEPVGEAVREREREAMRMLRDKKRNFAHGN